jgi:hypothetical protein
MNVMTRLLACTLVALAAIAASSCDSGGGIGVGLPASGARWGGGSSGPSVLVAGGPVY